MAAAPTRPGAGGGVYLFDFGKARDCVRRFATNLEHEQPHEYPSEQTEQLLLAFLTSPEADPLVFIQGEPEADHATP